MRNLVFRSTAARVAAWVWLVFTALNLIDIAIRGRDLTSMGVLAALLLGCGVAYAAGLRPRIEADEHGIRVYNPLRDMRAPWPAVKEIEATDAIVVHYTGAEGADRKIRSWVLHTSPRAQAKAEARTLREIRDRPSTAAVAEKVRQKTPISYAADQLNDLARAARRTPDDEAAPAGPAATTWSRKAIAALAVPAALLTTVLLTAVLT